MRKILASTVIWKTGNSVPFSPRKTPWVFHPDSKFKQYWNILVILGMTYSIILTPYQIAFDNANIFALNITDLVLDGIFFLDVIFSCFTAFHNEDLLLITNHLEILKNYAKTWLLIDLLSCFPFYFIMQASPQFSSLLRVTRLKLLFRLIRILKLLRLIKVFKRNEHQKTFHLAFKLSVQYERLVSFLLVICFIIHLIACFWIVIGNSSNSSNCWISNFGYQDLNNSDLYIVSLYWTVTTLTTVGYGDVFATNSSERIFAVFVEIVGIITYSYTISSISNVVSALDTRKALLNHKLDILRNLTRKVRISQHFFARITLALEYQHRNRDKEVEMILDDLPGKLSQELVKNIFAFKLEKNCFFEGKAAKFISWVSPWLQPALYENEFVYKEGEFADEMFFIIEGEVEFVVKVKDMWCPYIKIGKNYYFGEIDLLFSENKTHMSSVMAKNRSDLMRLSREKFEKLTETFENEAVEICMKARSRLERMTIKRTQIVMQVKEGLISKNYKIQEEAKNNVRISTGGNNCDNLNPEIKAIKELNDPERHINVIKSKVKSINLYSGNMLGMSYELLNILWQKNFKIDSL